jgi:hypothetical protein
MRHPVPPLRADEAALTQRLPHAQDRQQKPRLHRLYLLATRQAPDRQEVARLLGVHRHTSGRGLARTSAGGLAAVLARDAPAGQAVTRAPAVRASREQALRRPAGAAADEARRPWGRQPPGVEVKETTLAPLVRRRFKATRQVARPRHPRHP